MSEVRDTIVLDDRHIEERCLRAARGEQDGSDVFLEAKERKVTLPVRHRVASLRRIVNGASTGTAECYAERSLAARRRRSERTPRIEWLPSLNHPSASSACDPRGRTLGTARLQVGRQPVPGRQQFPFVHDVVAIEHGARLVAREQHGDPLRHPGADQVPGLGAPTIVEQTMGHARPATGVAQRGAPDAHRHAVAVKHARIAGLPPRQRRSSAAAMGRDRGQLDPCLARRASARASAIEARSRSI